MIQVIDRLADYVSDVVPTQAMREAEVQDRINARSPEGVLKNRLENGKTSTPTGNNY